MGWMKRSEEIVRNGAEDAIVADARDKASEAKQKAADDKRRAEEEK